MMRVTELSGESSGHRAAVEGAESVLDLNAIDPRVFPPTARRERLNGTLKLAGIPVTELAERFGTPLYVLDEQTVRDRARYTRHAFQREFARIGTEATVYYASKAFLCVETARWMSEEGLHIDVASGGELAVALAAGTDPAHLGFHGNNKSHAEIERAVSAGVGTIIIDSEQEVPRVAAAATAQGRRQRVCVRINSGVHAGAHTFLATAHEDQKFGLPLSRAIHVVRGIVGYDSLEFVGLHCHIGSQIFSTEAFQESARRLLSVYAELAQLLGAPVPELNLGGGFGVAYTPQQAEEVPTIDGFAAALADMVASTAEELGIALPRIAFEPGRSIIAQAGVTIYTVGTTKLVPLSGTGMQSDTSGASAVNRIDHAATARLYVSVDGGMSDNARPALYGAEYHARLANRESQAAAALVRVVGKHCESGDVVVQHEFLPDDVQPGDLLAVAVTGAYCWSLSSNYNYLPRPPVVAVQGGQASVIVRGEHEEDLLARSVWQRAERLENV